MPRAAPWSKSAMDKLVDSFSVLVSEAKERISDEEFRRAEKKFDRIVAKVRAARSRTPASLRG